MTTAREYVGPVRPPRGARWDAWCGTEWDGERSDEWRDGFNHAMRTMGLWIDFQASQLPRDVAKEPRRGPGLSSLGMLKSNLLGRLVRGEEIRRRPCPTHRGRLQMGGAALGQDLRCCDGTGWLRNAPDDAQPEREAPGAAHRLTHGDRASWWWCELPSEEAG